MVYDWEGKLDTCYRLYVVEKRSIDEVMQFWKAQGFTPSKRAFQCQFKRWHFPSKHNPAHKSPALVARIRQLWEQNETQASMLEILRQEGFNISSRSLSRLRGSQRFLLRTPNKTRSGHVAPATEGTLTEEVQDESTTAVNPEATEVIELAQDDVPVQKPVSYVPEISQALASQANGYTSQLQHEQPLEPPPTTKRKRPSGIRYDCEMPLYECKSRLELDNNQYAEVKATFEKICRDRQITRKKDNGWQEAKAALIEVHPNLRDLLRRENHPKEPEQVIDKRNRALDNLCQDIAKRLRTDPRQPLAVSKNILRLDPEHHRQVRDTFIEILREQKARTKTEMGVTRWNQIKEQWISKSPLLQHILSTAAPEELKDIRKALELVAREAQKRYRDNLAKEDPSTRRKLTQEIPGPGPAPPRMPKRSAISAFAPVGPAIPPPTPHSASAAVAINTLESQLRQAAAEHEDRIDPELLRAANHPALAMPEAIPAEGTPQTANFSYHEGYPIQSMDESGQLYHFARGAI